MLTKVHTGVSVVVGGIVGHRSGARQSIATAMRMRELRRHSPVSVDEPARDAADGLRRLGFAPAQPGYSAEVLRELADAMKLAEDPATSVGMGRKIKDSVRYVVDPLGRVPAIRTLLTPGLADVIRAWYRTEFAVSSVRMWRIGHVPPVEQREIHFGNQWHVDQHSVDTLKLFIQVTPDTAVDDSALRFLSRPDSRRAFLSGYVDDTHIYPPARAYLEDHARLFDAPPGAALLLDTDRCLHRAGMPRAGATRGMVQFMFRPCGEPPPGGDYLRDVPLDPNVYDGAIA